MPNSQDTYLSIATPSEGLFKDQGSRFLAFAYPVETEAEVKEILSRIRKEYHDARHHCSAFRLGLDGAQWRASDDGEPAGSAGRPILGQIDSAGLPDGTCYAKLKDSKNIFLLDAMMTDWLESTNEESFYELQK